MDPMNQTIITEFIFVGLTKNIHICILMFTALFFMYSLTVFGNTFVIITVLLSPNLHLPMYFFLCNLSFLDLCYSSCALPKAMVDLVSEKRTVSVTRCVVQMNTSVFLGGTESFLLAVMAYDRYVAIRFPLHYTIIMNWKTCKIIMIVMWFGSFMLLIVPTNLRPMAFCGESKLDHFVCELLAVLALACGNLTYHKLVRLVVSFFTLVVPLVFVVISYVVIILTILTIQSPDGRSRAFSTCASHLIVVSMYYGTTITMYIWPTKLFSSYLKYISLVYGVMTPVLNPLIYSLRNNDVKDAAKKIFNQHYLHANRFLQQI